MSPAESATRSPSSNLADARPATEDRLYLMKFDANTGVLSLDESFRDIDGKVGFSFVDKQWPHGWKGSALPHGTVFSR